MPISPAQATRNKDDSSDDDFYEPDEEELEEERECTPKLRAVLY